MKHTEQVCVKLSNNNNKEILYLVAELIESRAVAPLQMLLLLLKLLPLLALHTLKL